MLDLESIRAEITARLNRYTVEWPALESPPAHLALKQGAPARYLQRALAKLDAGTYGLCDTCEEPIDADRLRAVIGACNCLSCQHLVDNKTPS